MSLSRSECAMLKKANFLLIWLPLNGELTDEALVRLEAEYRPMIEGNPEALTRMVARTAQFNMDRGGYQWASRWYEMAARVAKRAREQQQPQR